MVGSEISVVIPIFFPTMKTKAMSDANLLHAKAMTSLDVEWIIVETESQYYRDLADIHIYERNKTTPTDSVNRAFACASGKYVVFLANDVKVCDNWIEKMYECFSKYSDCGLASLGNNEHADPTDDVIIDEGHRFYFSVCMLSREDAWFDPKFPYNFADTDLVFRLHTQNKKFYKNLSGHVFHKPHSTYGRFCGDTKDYQESRQRFLDKHNSYLNDPFYQILGGVPA